MYIFFLCLLKNIDCGYSLEPPRHRHFFCNGMITSVSLLALVVFHFCTLSKKVQVGKDQEKAQSEKDSHSKNRGGKKPN